MDRHSSYEGKTLLSIIVEALVDEGRASKSLSILDPNLPPRRRWGSSTCGVPGQIKINGLRVGAEPELMDAE